MPFGAGVSCQVINGNGEEAYRRWIKPWHGGERCALLIFRCPARFSSDETVQVAPGSIWRVQDNLACLYSRDAEWNDLVKDFRKACWQLWHFATTFETLSSDHKIDDQHLRVKYFTPVFCEEEEAGLRLLDTQDEEMLLTASTFIQMRQAGGAQELLRMLQDASFDPVVFYRQYQDMQQKFLGGRGHLRLVPSSRPTPG